MNLEYQQQGFFVSKQFFDQEILQGIRELATDFHHNWIKENYDFYQEKAVNSAYLTSPEYLSESQRIELFQFIASHTLMSLVESLLPSAMFMNTQLFFDPVNKQQKNYWHRDLQYHLNLEQQKAALAGPEVIHVRISLVDEPGIELIPGSHKQWDSAEELQVRLEQNGCKNSNNLTRGKKIELAAGDALVFSANMIHRGLYGKDRLALDILFCAAEPELAEFIREDCLPSIEMMQELEVAAAFEASRSLK